MSMSDIEKLAKNFDTQYFERIFEGGWKINRSFALVLALLDRYGDKFDEDYLINRGWGKSIAAKVLAEAGHTESQRRNGAPPK